MGRKKIYQTEEERIAARREAQRQYMRRLRSNPKSRKALNAYHRERMREIRGTVNPRGERKAPPSAPQASPEMLARIERLEETVEKLKWAIYGKSIGGGK